MYDTRQFRSILYILILLGVTGYCVATEAPLLWVFAVTATLINAWLVSAGLFVPLPRVWSGLITLLALGFFALTSYFGDVLLIITFSQFAVILQVIKLYEQCQNRDYAQLLVLSLLVMVAAAISTASLFFGFTFLVYLFVSLYCSLLFHLKSETYRARSKYGQPAHKISPATLRQDQRDCPSR